MCENQGAYAGVKPESGEHAPVWRHSDGSIRVDHMDAREGDYFGTFNQRQVPERNALNILHFPRPPIVVQPSALLDGSTEYERAHVCPGIVESGVVQGNYPRQTATPYGDTPTEWAESEKLRRVDPRMIVEVHAVDTLRRQLIEAEAAHARYVEAGHSDDDWPTFYARHMNHLQPEVAW